MCTKARDENWYPNRLLDLSNADSVGSGTIRLIETSKELMRGPYVTLSHCWGGAVDTKLTSLRLEEFFQGLSVKDLPKTFREAVSVARCLGVRYLWIDALVIVQDSQTDWARESSLMGQVYQNSLCNIGATNSNTAQRGCFLTEIRDL